MSSENRVILVGASAGGVVALHKLLENLPPVIDGPLIIIQHLPDLRHVDVETIYFAGPSRTVIEVEDKMPIEPGHVYFAPGGYHLLIEKDETFSLNQDDPVRFSRPSIDLSFESAAAVFGQRLIAVLLTGANADGAAGLTHVRRQGGVTIVQDPATAQFPEMPSAAIALEKPDFIIGLEALPDLLSRVYVEGAR